MPYTASIDRRNPGCFLFLVDQSDSMGGALAGQPGQRKMDAAADAVNRVVYGVVQRCSRGMEVGDYFDIGILGYGHAQETHYDEKGQYFSLGGNEVAIPVDPRDNSWQSRTIYRETIISALPDTSLDSPFLPLRKLGDIADLEERRIRESDGSGGTIELPRRIPVWLHPHSGLQTPMCTALGYAARAVEQWTARHPDSFPPIVINISDGEATDGDPEPLARRIMGLGTSDGNALVFNCHLSEASRTPIQYPDSESSLPDSYARQMFRMSSVLPPGSREHAARLGIPVSGESRCCVFNADMVSLVQFLDIGTRGSVDLR